MTEPILGAQRGQDESVYVVLDLEDVDSLPLPGSRMQLQVMEMQQPVLQLADGTRLVGRFEETVGTQLILADSIQGDGSHRVRLVTHTDKRICFTTAAAAAAGRGAHGVAADAPAAAAAAAAAATGQQPR